MIIGISGRKHSGKSTLATIVARHLRRSLILDFAEPIRSFVADLAGISLDELHKVKNDSAMDVRKAMQLLGTEWGRAINPNIWVDYWERKALAALNGVEVKKVSTGSHFGGHYLEIFDYVIASDCRFINEAQRIKNLGGILIFREGGVGGDAHKSETEMDSPEFQEMIDIKVPHLGSIKELDSFVLRALDDHLWTRIKT